MDAKNPKLIGAVATSFLFVVWMSLRASNVDIEPIRDTSKDNEEISFDMKASTFKVPALAKKAPAVPVWGSFKTTEEIKTVVESKETQETLKKIAALVAKKQKEEKKKKLAQKKKQKRKNVIVKAPSQVEKARRYTGDGWKTQDEYVDNVVAVAIPVKKDVEKQIAEEEPSFITLEQWRTLIVYSANPAETQKLVESYKKGSLGSPDWFYVLTKEMLLSSDPQVQTEGVKALNATPSLASYSMLVGAKADVENEETRAEIAKSLDSYATDFNRVAILSQGLHSEIVEVRMESSLLITKAAQIHLRDAKTGRQRRIADAPLAHGPYFKGTIIPILQDLIQNDASPEVRQSSQVALDSIQRYTTAMTAALP
ncbi:MAG: hypothetical protein AB7F59_14520 [Bdellovibrionales bacterium]